MRDENMLKSIEELLEKNKNESKEETSQLKEEIRKQNTRITNLLNQVQSLKESYEDATTILEELAYMSTEKTEKTISEIDSPTKELIVSDKKLNLELN